jgi:ankyrin repeat protein
LCGHYFTHSFRIGAAPVKVKETSLHIAIVNQNVDIIFLLLVNGADINIPWIFGEFQTSVFQLAKSHGVETALKVSWNTQNHKFYPKPIQRAIKALLMCANRKLALPLEILYIIFDNLAVLSILDLVQEKQRIKEGENDELEDII